MNKHTPGPWAAIPDCPEEGNGDWYVIAENEDVLSRGSSAPDAALIAAAPELLAALRIAEKWCPTDASWATEVEAIHAAIAKAEGVS